MSTKKCDWKNRSAINLVYIGCSCLINGIMKKIIKQTKKNYLVVLTGYSKIFKKNKL